MKNKFLLASVTFLSVVSIFACTSPKKESSKSSSASSSTNVAKETTKSSSKVKEELSDNNESLAETKRIGSADYGYVIFQVTGKRMIVSKSEIIFSIQIKTPSILLF